MPPAKGITNDPRRGQSKAIISRRALTGALTALAVSVRAQPSGAWPRHAGRPPGDGTGLELSATFLRNAYGFYGSAVAAHAHFPAQALQFLAIATELGLKAFLLHQGFSDHWNRVHLGHDLCKTLRCAWRAGFHDLPPSLPSLPMLTAILGPYYMHHGLGELRRETVQELFWSGAGDTVRALLDQVHSVVSLDRLGDRPDAKVAEAR